MTEHDLDRLATLIVEKIFDKQAEYDAQFMQDLVEQGAMEQVVVFKAEMDLDASLSEEDKRVRLLEDLNNKLEEALSEEDYKLAARLKEEILRLKKQ